jgi:hypothetical protein
MAFPKHTRSGTRPEKSGKVDLGFLEVRLDLGNDDRGPDCADYTSVRRLNLKSLHAGMNAPIEARDAIHIIAGAM